MKISYSVMGELTELLDSFADKNNAKIENLACSLELLANEIKISFTIREMTDAEILQRDGA